MTIPPPNQDKLKKCWIHRWKENSTHNQRTCMNCQKIQQLYLIPKTANIRKVKWINLDVKDKPPSHSKNLFCERDCEGCEYYDLEISKCNYCE
jgi:hypothetical protein